MSGVGVAATVGEGRLEWQERHEGVVSRAELESRVETGCGREILLYGQMRESAGRLTLKL
jgi:hypothetical protein